MRHAIVIRSLLAGLVVALSVLAAVAAEPAIPGYADYEAMRSQLETLGRSKFAQLQSLGRTLGGREVYLLKVGGIQPDQKPAILIVGSVHPPHLLGSELAVRIARQFVQKADAGDQDLRRMLDRVTFYIIPRPAPDPCEAFFQKPYDARIRNERPVDDDHDGRIDEDGPDDMNGDGWITMLRVEDGTGPYIKHPADERILIKADPERGEVGRYSLYSEGIDNDKDDLLNEDPRGGVALDRNFTFRYPYFGAAAGPNQVSEVESRAVADFAFSHANIAMVLTFTPTDNLMHLWKVDAAAEEKPIKTTLQGADAPYYRHFAKQYQEILGRKDAPESEPDNGSLSSWAYFHYGRWSLATRGWWIPKVEDTKEPETGKKREKKAEAQGKEAAEDKRGADELNALRWFGQEKIDGFVAWKAIQHPFFAGRKVELGGFRPFLELNPPASQLDGLAEKHGKFVRWIVEQLPRLEIQEVKAESRGAGTWRITAAVKNDGYLPTMPRMGKIVGDLHPLQAELDLPKGVSLVMGYARVRLEPLGGSARVEQSWLVRVPQDGPKALGVRVWSPSVGSASKRVELVAEREGI